MLAHRFHRRKAIHPPPEGSGSSCLTVYNSSMKSTKERPRRKGPVPGPLTERYQVLLEPELAEWAKAQPGGLSELLRRSLREVYEASQGEGNLGRLTAIASEQSLGKIWDTPEEDEAWRNL